MLVLVVAIAAVAIVIVVLSETTTASVPPGRNPEPSGDLPPDSTGPDSEWWAVRPFTFTPTFPTSGESMIPLKGTALPDAEVLVIADVAASVGVDARLLAAIRRAEMGGPGREFGVLSVSAPTYQEQATWAARTIAANQQRYEAATGQSATDATGRFTPAFIGFLGSRYAPINAANDPLGLNSNWVGNVTRAYAGIEYA